MKAAEPNVRNIVLITIDCLRADHLSCLGYSKQTTPNLDYLSDEAALFSQAISVGSWTGPSFISMFTSTYPLMYGGQLYVANSRTTVAQVLRDHGYHTAAFHSNPWLSSYHGYHQGFGTFNDCIQKVSYKGTLRKVRKLAEKITGKKGRLYDFLSGVSAILVRASYGNKAEELNKKAIRWLRDNPSNFFIWLHYMDIHEPYYPKNSSPFKRYYYWKLNKKAINAPRSLLPHELGQLIDLYDPKIRHVDEMIGSLMNTLNQWNILHDTFVIITADHGQQFMEHGDYAHGFDLYDELIHVPLIIHGPGLEKQVISQQVSLLDLAPTILDIVNINKPKDFLGNSLLPLITDKTKVTDLTAISEEGKTRTSLPPGAFNIMTPKLNKTVRKISLRTEKWKYIYNEGKRDELYCLQDDPKETQNVIDAQPDIAAELRAKIMTHVEFENRSMPGEKERIKARARKLKATRKI